MIIVAIVFSLNKWVIPLVKGDNNLYGFYLKSGQNEMTFKGKGTILVRFRKEVL